MGLPFLESQYLSLPLRNPSVLGEGSLLAIIPPPICWLSTHRGPFGSAEGQDLDPFPLLWPSRAPRRIVRREGSRREGPYHSRGPRFPGG